MNSVLLTKSLLLQGIQCPKQLYLKLHYPDLEIEESNSRFKTIGTELGELARSLYKGKLVSEKNPKKALTETEDLLKSNSILFEAAFKFDDIYFRADVFSHSSTGVSVTEFKASTEISDVYKKDLAIQAYVLNKLGKNIESLKIGYINKKYTKNLPISDLFIIEDLTSEVMLLIPWVEEEIKKIKFFLGGSTTEDIDIGPHCTNPHDCPYIKHCRKQKNVPELSVLNLNFNKKWDYYRQGKFRIKDLSDSDFNTDKQKSTLKKIQSKEPIINKEMIKGILSTWQFPIYFLDFETISFGYPIFDQLRPFQEIPFQYSCFLLESESSPAIHKESYLVDHLNVDPRIQLADNLVKALGTRGSIVAYNASFEKRVIADLAELFPNLRESLLAINERIVDLLPVMREHVYYSDFKLSWSIKSIVPAIFGKLESYSNLAVSDGLAAQNSFIEAVKSGTLNKIRDDLKKYCDKDVFELVRLLQFLKEKIKT
jgi:hypothetical protein